MPRTGCRSSCHPVLRGPLSARAGGVDGETRQALPGLRGGYVETRAVRVDRDGGRVAERHAERRAGLHRALGARDRRGRRARRCRIHRRPRPRCPGRKSSCSGSPAIRGLRRAAGAPGGDGADCVGSDRSEPLCRRTPSRRRVIASTVGGCGSAAVRPVGPALDDQRQRPGREQRQPSQPASTQGQRGGATFRHATPPAPAASSVGCDRLRARLRRRPRAVASGDRPSSAE